MAGLPFATSVARIAKTPPQSPNHARNVFDPRLTGRQDILSRRSINRLPIASSGESRDQRDTDRAIADVHAPGQVCVGTAELPLQAPRNTHQVTMCLNYGSDKGTVKRWAEGVQ